MALDFEIGQEVVVMARRGVPLQCNSLGNRQHPCRAIVTKVGKTRVHASVNGRVKALGMVLSIEEAKAQYREALGADHPRVEELVASL